MRKLTLLFLSVVCVLCLAFSLTACGNTEQGASQGLTYELSEDKESYTVVGIGSYDGNNLVIPSKYEGKPVTSIGQAAFYDCKKLTNVTIPEGITTIGEKAFEGCIIKKLTAPANLLTNISNNTLETVIITSGEEIPDYAFANCNMLKSVTIPDSVTSIGRYAFNNCTGLTSVTIPNSVTTIGEDAFSCCYKLVEVYNLSSLNLTKGGEDNGRVGYYALDIYTSKTTPSNLSTTKDGYIFYESRNDGYYLMGCKGNKTNLVLPDTFNNKYYSIYDYAFYENSNIKRVTIPDSATDSIGSYAFGNCINLISATIGKGVTSIGKYAFRDCINLKSVIFADTSNWILNGYSFPGMAISVTDPSDNAINLRGDDGYYTWEKI